MNLQKLIKKYNLKEGDEVVCIKSGYEYTTGTYTLRPIFGGSGINLGFTVSGKSWSGNGCIHACEFTLPENSPYLKHKFVQSFQPMTEGNQQALLDLGYSWVGSCEVQYLDKDWLHTDEDGYLAFHSGLLIKEHKDLLDSKVYTFTTTTVATLTPVAEVEVDHSKEISDIEKTMNNAQALLKECQDKLAKLT